MSRAIHETSTGRRTRFALAAAAAVLSGCSMVQRVVEPPPPSRPGADEGMSIYTVGNLSFEMPTAWEASGDERHVQGQPQDGSAKIDVQLLDRTYRNQAECMAAAQEALVRGSANLQNVRRHPTAVAGHKGITQEADAGSWHGWAYAVCEGGRQYRIFLTGMSPVKPETLTAFRLLVSSAQFGGAS